MKRTKATVGVVLERPSSPLRVHSRLAGQLIQRVVGHAQHVQEEDPANRSSACDLKRTIHLMIDLMDEDESPFLVWVHESAKRARGRKSGRSAQDPEAAVRVAVLSLVLASAARLDRAECALVGHATLLLQLHVGTEDVVADVQNPESSKWNPALSSSLLQLHGVFEGSVLAALCALEEVTSVGGGASNTSLLGRIFKITSSYAQLVCRDLQPCRALGLLVDRPQTQIDPLLLKLFVRALGLYPPGTMVQLRSGETGVVQRASRDPKRLDRPLVRLLFDRQGQVLDAKRDVDLGEEASGDPKPQILRGVDP